MGVVTARHLSSLAGRAPASSNLEFSPAVPDEEALSASYIPADGLSACLISPSRILVTAGAAQDDRVLPFSVIRYLDLSQSDHHVWTKPQHLRRRRGGTDIPVPRVEHSLTHVPFDGKLYLFGGMKIDPDLGDICKTLFAFDPRNKGWLRVETEKPGRVKADPDDSPGPRFAHSAVCISVKERGARPNSRAKPVASLFVYGGYSSRDDHHPRSEVHVLNVRTSKWSLRRPSDHSVDPPRRAYHASAVTKDQRYMIIHGGNHSDDDDSLTISDGLFVFDVLLSQWFVPVPHPSSCNPPSARRRHSLVNGVGRHDGWLVMYGGFLREGMFSNDMYICRILSVNGQVGVIWEKVDVRGSIGPPVGGQVREKHGAKKRTVAGGCLISIPKLKKYILLGGKGEFGLRDTPLLLDPYESDEIAISQSVPPEEEGDDEDENELLPLREQAEAMNDEDPVNGQSSSANGDADLESDDDGDIIVNLEDNTIRGVTNQRKRVRSALSTPPGDKPLSARPTLSIPPTPSEKSRSPTPGERSVFNSDKGKRPATSEDGSIAVKLRIRLSDSGSKKSAAQSQGDDDFMRSSKRRPPGRNTDDLERVTPPAKRSRFLSPPDPDDVVALDFGDADSEVRLTGSANKSQSYRSEFLSASELRRKGKQVGRGRGRGGRGRGGTSARARSADDRAEEKRMDALEKLNKKNEELMANLKTENKDLVRESNGIKKDNIELNEQVKRLLEEIRILTFREKENARKKGLMNSSAVQRRPNGNARGSQADDDERPLSLATDTPTTKGRSQTQQVTELKAEKASLTTEKEGLLQNVHDLEEDNRKVEKELCVMKNQFDRTVIDRDAYQQEKKELQKKLVVLKKDKEAAEKRAEMAENDVKLLKREVEMLKADVKVEQQRQQNGRLELSTADRMVKTIQGKLAETAKRRDDFEAREREVRRQLEKVEERNRFLQTQLDDGSARNRKLEDEKIEILSEKEAMTIELLGRIKECSAALKDAEKSREALERERAKRVNEGLGGEQIRLRAEVEKYRKECAWLRQRLNGYDGVKNEVLTLRAMFNRISVPFERDGEEFDGGLSQPVGDSGKESAERQKDVMNVVESRVPEEADVEGALRPKQKNIDEKSSANREPAIPVVDADDQIPDSDDADEP